MQSRRKDTLEEWDAIKFCFKLGKNVTEMYGMLHTAFGASGMNRASVFSGIRNSRKPGSLWGMMRGVGGVRKSIHRSWLAKGLGLGLLCWGFKAVKVKIMKTLIHKNILPTDPNKKIKLIIYKFKTSNLVIRNNSSPLIRVLQKTNVIYKFKCPLGDCISNHNNIYVGLTSTTLSRRLTIHLSDTSSIAQHLKKTFMPNNTTTKNSHRQHNNTRTSK